MKWRENKMPKVNNSLRPKGQEERMEHTGSRIVRRFFLIANFRRFLTWFSHSREYNPETFLYTENMEHMIQHIAFIMDGNRTWAREHLLPQFEWHRRGYNNTKQIMRDCLSLQIPYCSFWALSDDNITERLKEEVSYLFELLTIGILDMAEEANQDNVRIRVIWDRTLLPPKCQENILKAELLTKDNTRMTAILAIWYGWQEEIIRAVNQFIQKMSWERATKENFLPFVESSEFPPADLIIRSWGHQRHSGFLLYLSPYAEYYFSPKNWPSFDKWDIISAIEDFSGRKRKFGK